MADLEIDLRRLRWGLAAVVVTLLAAHIMAEVVLRLSTDLFNLNEESTVGTWVSTMLLASSGVGFLLASRTATGTTRLGWRIGAGILALLSLDEVATIHERVGKIISNHKDTGGVLFFAWVIPGAVIAVGLIAALVVFARRLERRAAVLLVAGGALFFLGAVGMEMVGGSEMASGTADGETFVAVEQSRLYLLTSAFEESLEFIGESVLVYGVARHLERTRRAVVAVAGAPATAPDVREAPGAAAPRRLPSAGVALPAPDPRAISADDLRRPAPADPGAAFSPPPDGR